MMRYVRLDDEEDRKSIAAVKEAEAKRARARKLAQAKLRKEKREHEKLEKEALLRLEEEAEIHRLRESRRQVDTVEIAARKAHSDKNAPSLRRLSQMDEWSPEDLAYVRFYMGAASRIQPGVGRVRAEQFMPISLFGNTFTWNGVRYVKARSF